MKNYFLKSRDAFDFVLVTALIIACVCCAVFASSAHAADVQIPASAYHHQRDFIRTAHALWGLDAPTADMAAQIHAESHWRAHADNGIAQGMAQFTPATVKTMAQIYPRDLGTGEPFNPRWAMRALVRYDKQMFDAFGFAANECERMAFVLSGYNGGPGWVARDRALAKIASADDTRWFGAVENYSRRSRVAMAENRAYARRILLNLAPRYQEFTAWTAPVCT